MILADFVERIHRQAHRQWAQAGSPHGLTLSVFEYLRAIRAQERMKTDRNDHGQHLQDVVVQMGVSKASASAMVLKLEEAGLVRRVPCQMDARAQHILLTEAGRQKLAVGESIFAKTAEAVLSDFSDTEREELAALLLNRPAS